MKKLNKVAALVLAAAMSVSLLACGGDTPASTDSGKPAASTEVTPSGDNGGSGPVEISLYRRTFNLAAVDDAQVKKVEDVLALGDKVRVLVTEMKDGKTRLSIKQARAVEHVKDED